MLQIAAIVSSQSRVRVRCVMLSIIALNAFLRSLKKVVVLSWSNMSLKKLKDIMKFCSPPCASTSEWTCCLDLGESFSKRSVSSLSSSDVASSASFSSLLSSTASIESSLVLSRIFLEYSLSNSAILWVGLLSSEILPYIVFFSLTVNWLKTIKKDHKKFHCKSVNWPPPHFKF